MPRSDHTIAEHPRRSIHRRPRSTCSTTGACAAYPCAVDSHEYVRAACLQLRKPSRLCRWPHRLRAGHAAVGTQHTYATDRMRADGAVRDRQGGQRGCVGGRRGQDVLAVAGGGVCAAEDEGDGGAVPRPHGVAGRRHRAGVLQRRPAAGDEGCGPHRRPRRPPHHQRAHRRCSDIRCASATPPKVVSLLPLFRRRARIRVGTRADAVPSVPARSPVRVLGVCSGTCDWCRAGAVVSKRRSPDAPCAEHARSRTTGSRGLETVPAAAPRGAVAA